jgi:hypothetical protein
MRKSMDVEKEKYPNVELGWDLVKPNCTIIFKGCLNTTPGHLPKGKLSQDTIETVYTNVHCSTTHNSQGMETTQMPYNW